MRKKGKLIESPSRGLVLRAKGPGHGRTTSITTFPSTAGAGGRVTLFLGRLQPKQKIWPHMLGWEVAGVFLEISRNRSKWASHHPPRSLGGDGSLGAARSPSCCLGIGCSSCSFAWWSKRPIERKGARELLVNKPCPLAQTDSRLQISPHLLGHSRTN